MNAVDTNVLVYSLDVDEPVKQAKAKALLIGLVGATPTTILTWQVASELLGWLRKWEAAGRVSGANVEQHFRDILALFPLALPTPQAFVRYFDLHARFSLSHWDAMLLAACKEAASPRCIPKTWIPAQTTTASPLSIPSLDRFANNA
jgi:predicted nucleic acid-binding protein